MTTTFFSIRSRRSRKHLRGQLSRRLFSGRAVAVAVLAAAEIAILFLYFIRTRVAIDISEWLRSFSWYPVTTPFQLKTFLGIALVSMGSLAVYLGWLALCWLAGIAMLERILPLRERESSDNLDSAEETLLALGLGLGTLSLWFYFLGVFHLYYPVAPFLTALAFLAVGFQHMRRTRSTAHRMHRRVEWNFLWKNWMPRSAENAALGLIGLLCAGALVFHLLGALLPPASFDELNYQLAIPKLYAINHGFVPTPHNHLSYLPKNMNMLFTLGLLIGSPAASKLFSWGMGVLNVLAVYIFGRRLIGRKAAFLAGALFFLTPVVGNQFRVAGTDLGTTFYELLAVFLLLHWLETSSPNPRSHPLPGEERDGEGKGYTLLALSSVLWGFALGTKYSAIPGFVAGFLLLISHIYETPPEFAFFYLSFLRCSSHPREGGGPGLDSRLQTAGMTSPPSRGRRQKTEAMVVLAVYLLPAILLWSPWLIQNWWDSGNPVNPMLSTVIRSRNFYFAGVYKPMVDYAAGLGIQDYFPIGGLRDLLRLPWRILTERNDFNHDLGPAWLLCVPLAFLPFRTRMPQRLKPAATLCALYWLLWLASKIHMTRYFVTGLALTSLLGGWLIASALEWIPSGSVALWAFMIPLLAAMLQQSMRMVYIQNIYKKPWGYLDGRTAVKDYLEAVQPNFSFDAFRFVNEHTPRDATILVFNEFRTFYLNRNFLASTPWDHDPWHEIVCTSATLDDIARKLKDLGVTHMLINDDYVLRLTGSRILPGWSKEDWIKGIHFWKYYTRRVFYDDNGTWVAELK